MPKYVDHDERRTEIAEAALRMIARDGPGAVSIRALAKELGGSTSMVTYYYPTREAVLRDLGHRLCRRWIDDLDRQLDGLPNGRQRLEAVLHWLLPLEDEDRETESARFALLAARSDPELRAILLDFDGEMRGVLRRHLDGIVDDQRAAVVADALRALTNGIVVDAVLAPAAWPPERQLEVLNVAVAPLVGSDW